MRNRFVRHFGFEFNYSSNKINSDKPIEPIPQEYDFIVNRLIDEKLITQRPDQLTINYYFPGISQSIKINESVFIYSIYC